MGLGMYLDSYPKIEGMTFEEVLQADNNLETISDEKILKHVIDRGNYIKWKSLAKEVGYWRKANHIHKWFVDNVQGGVDECDSYIVSKEDLKKLLNVCRQVLKHKEEASQLLPTESDFFFGGTEYDEYYFKEVEKTKRIIEKVLNEHDFENYYLVYSSSW